MRTREWGVAKSTAAAETACRSVAAAHELMKLFSILYFSARAPL